MSHREAGVSNDKCDTHTYSSSSTTSEGSFQTSSTYRFKAKFSQLWSDVFMFAHEKTDRICVF